MNETTMPVEMELCMGSSCYSRGNSNHLETIWAYLEQNNLEARVKFRGCLCSGQCSQGPVLKISGCLHTGVDQKRLYDILYQTFRRL